MDASGRGHALVADAVCNGTAKGWLQAHAGRQRGRGADQIRRARTRVVLLDLMLPDADGLMVMREMLELRPETRVIVITANGSVNNAIDATREGAHDFLVKPLGRHPHDRRRGQRVCRIAAKMSPLTVDDTSRTMRWIAPSWGNQSAMQEVHGRIAAVAGSTAPVFILGESGTGKELCARAIHLKSARAAQRFVTLNCSAADPEHLEIELFGQAAPKPGRGQTQLQARAGAIAQADGGTLFVQNIQDMSPELQAGLSCASSSAPASHPSAIRARSRSMFG